MLEIERVGIHDNFFDLGGHSLKAIQLISRLQKRLHVKTDIAKILANPTIFELTRLLALEKPRALVEIPRLAYQPHYELSHAQKRIWVISYFQDGSTVYNAPGAYIVDGNLNIAALKRSFDLLIERHESLRTVFLLIDNEPRQKILLPADSGFTIKEIDVRGHKNSEHIITEILEKDAQQPFDLENGPLMRVSLRSWIQHSSYYQRWLVEGYFDQGISATV